MTGQRRRYAILGAITYRGPLTAAGVGILVRSPAFIVRRDLAILGRAGLIESIDDEVREPRYRLAHHYASSEVQQLRNAVAARDRMLATAGRGAAVNEASGLGQEIEDR